MNFLDPLRVFLASLTPQELARQELLLNIESVSTRILLLLCNPDIQSDVWATPPKFSSAQGHPADRVRLPRDGLRLGRLAAPDIVGHRHGIGILALHAGEWI